MKLTHFYVSLSALLLAFLWTSCGENHALKEVTYSFDKQNIDWLESDTDFVMQIDSSGMSQDFMLWNSNYEMSKSWSTTFGITTQISYTENQYLNFYSSFNNHLSVSLTAGHPPYGDDLFVKFNDVDFRYDTKFQIVTSVFFGMNSKSKSMTDDTYSDKDEILSTIEILDTCTVSGKTYHEVLHFKLLDFEEDMKDLTPSEILIAKNSGLIQVKYHNGMTLNRLAE